MRNACTKTSWPAGMAGTTRYTLSGIARCFFGLAILATNGQAAMAQTTTTLICRMDASMPFIEKEPSIIELNEAQSIVTERISAKTLTINGALYEGFSGGPLPATFAADTIFFSDAKGFSYTLNRLTGILSNNANWKWTCQAGKKQF